MRRKMKLELIKKTADRICSIFPHDSHVRIKNSILAKNRIFIAKKDIIDGYKKICIHKRCLSL